MPLYFFDLDERGDVTADEEGRELSDPAMARVQAIAEARALMSGDILRGRLCLAYRLVVREKNGAVVMAVPFSDAVEAK